MRKDDMKHSLSLSLSLSVCVYNARPLVLVEMMSMSDYCLRAAQQLYATAVI